MKENNEAYENLKKAYPDGIPFAVKYAIDEAINVTVSRLRKQVLFQLEHKAECNTCKTICGRLIGYLQKEKV